MVARSCAQFAYHHLPSRAVPHSNINMTSIYSGGNVMSRRGVDIARARSIRPDSPGHHPGTTSSIGKEATEALP